MLCESCTGMHNVHIVTFLDDYVRTYKVAMQMYVAMFYVPCR